MAQMRSANWLRNCLLFGVDRKSSAHSQSDEMTYIPSPFQVSHCNCGLKDVRAPQVALPGFALGYSGGIG
jgi:hypothetical protein